MAQVERQSSPRFTTGRFRFAAGGLLALGLAAAIAAGGANASDSSSRNGTDTGGFPQASCFWFGPANLKDPATNLAYPEETAYYWGARFRIPAGAKLVFEGRYPRARFMSLTAYEGDGATAALNDIQIKPSKGSTNPFKQGAKRTAKKRSFSVTIPGDGATTGRSDRNLLETNLGPVTVQELLYRVYMPEGPSARSVASLPRPTLVLEDGTRARGQAACDAVNDSQRYFNLPSMQVGTYQTKTGLAGEEKRPTHPAQPTPRWEKFFNRELAISLYDLGTGNEGLREAIRQEIVDGRIPLGGYYDNLAVSYLAAPINRNFGDIVVLRGKLPTFVRSGKKAKRMGSGQLRYWSLCTNESPVSTAAVDCVSDYQVRLRRKRSYTIVVSTKEDRPANARGRCGVTWLDWGSRLDEATPPRPSGTLILRNLLPSRKFKQAAQRVGIEDISVTSSGTKSERDVMGDYLPSGSYAASKEAFESEFGCPRR